MTGHLHSCVSFAHGLWEEGCGKRLMGLSTTTAMNMVWLVEGWGGVRAHVLGCVRRRDRREAGRQGSNRALRHVRTRLYSTASDRCAALDVRECLPKVGLIHIDLRHLGLACPARVLLRGLWGRGGEAERRVQEGQHGVLGGGRRDMITRSSSPRPQVSLVCRRNHIHPPEVGSTQTTYARRTSTALKTCSIDFRRFTGIGVPSALKLERFFADNCQFWNASALFFAAAPSDTPHVKKGDQLARLERTI